MIDCPSKESLIELLSGRDDSALAEEVELHLETCGICQQRVVVLAGEIEPRYLLSLRRGEQTSLDGSLANVIDEPSDAFLRQLQQNGPPTVETLTDDDSIGVLEFAQVNRSWPPGYEMLEEIGHGGTSTVFKARRLDDGAIVAIKRLTIGPSSPMIDKQRAFRGSESLTQLKHRNIVALYDRFEYHGSYYGVLEYLEGGGLDRRSRGNPWDPVRAARLIRELAVAVQFIHDHGVIHRDLKPANILLTSDDVPKIADFGLSRSFASASDITDVDAVLGTPAFMSPEQAMGKSAEAGPATDIYALGAIFYELLTGRPPFLAPSRLETMEQVIRDTPVPPSQRIEGIPPRLDSICLRCLSKDAAQRYESADKLASDLAEFLNETTTSNAAVLSKKGTHARFAVGRRTILYASALLLVLVVSACVAWAVLASIRSAKAEAELVHVESSLYTARMKLAEQALERGDASEARDWLALCTPKPGRPDLRTLRWHELVERAMETKR